MGGSIPQLADIQFDVVTYSTYSVCPRQPAAQLAILNYDIIEWDACVTILVCLAAVATLWIASSQSQPLRELLNILLSEIATKGLTTIFLP